MSKKAKIQDLVPDDKNANKGTEEGQALLERSLGELGIGRSILIDKDNKVIAGNKTLEAAIASGVKKVVIIETTGDKLVAVKRTDLDLDTKEGREMAIADNAVAKKNLQWDNDVIDELTEKFNISKSDWGFFGSVKPVDVEQFDGTDDTNDKKDDGIQSVICPNCFNEFKVNTNEQG